jgi:hypothetical protein
MATDIAERFDEEEPPHPLTQQLLDETRRQAVALAGQVRCLLDDFTLPAKPDAHVVEAFSSLITHEAKR